MANLGLETFRALIPANGKELKKMARLPLLKALREEVYGKVEEEIWEALQEFDEEHVDLDLCENDDDFLYYECEMSLGKALRRHVGLLQESYETIFTAPPDLTNKLLFRLPVETREAIAGILIYQKARSVRRMAKVGEQNGRIRNPDAYIEERDEALLAFHEFLKRKK